MLASLMMRILIALDKEAANDLLMLIMPLFPDLELISTLIPLLWLLPITTANQQSLVSIPTRSRNFHKNKVSTVQGGRKALKITRSTQGQYETVFANGRIPIGHDLVKVYRAVSNPTLSAGEIVRSFLKKHGITVTGKVREAKIPTNATLFYELESYEMSRIISGLNKYSNNYIADVLLKNLGARFSGPEITKGTFNNGLKVLRDFMTQEVGASRNFELFNGSGLDPRNCLSAKQVVKVLSYMYSRMDLFPEFLASLPASGWDGTLEDRFRKVKLRNLQGRVRAKTGSLGDQLRFRLSLVSWAIPSTG